MEGDIVVLYSDGLSDNVFRSGMYQCLEEEMEGGVLKSPSKAADCLARKAYWLGKERDYISPFQKAGRKAFKENKLTP